MVMFGSNNYLDLANDERVKGSRKAIGLYGTSCSGSRFMNGTLELHEELEKRLATFIHKEPLFVSLPTKLTWDPSQP